MTLTPGSRRGAPGMARWLGQFFGPLLILCIGIYFNYGMKWVLIAVAAVFGVMLLGLAAIFLSLERKQPDSVGQLRAAWREQRASRQ